jgi:hypothetical protein
MLIAAIPPTTPPAMAPVLELFLLELLTTDDGVPEEDAWEDVAVTE